MDVAIAGASGFVGRALTSHLLERGYGVTALGRSATSLPTDARTIDVDVGDKVAITTALTGADAAYYLVHSMASGDDFRDADLRLATTFGHAAAEAGVGRIVYLGALGDAPDSAHLASRQEVGSALGATGTAVVELRAAVVFGSGGISFEMLRYLTERLPAMVCPRWVRTRIQPIALTDLLDYLEQSLQVDPGTYQIGGADVTTYREMISEYARVRTLRPRRIVDIPLLTPHLSSYWVDLVTPVDRAVSHALIESLVTEVVVTDAGPTQGAFSVTPMGVERALAIALKDQAEGVTRSLFDRRSGLADGVHTVVVDIAAQAGVDEAVARDLEEIGGTLGWYGAALGWALRILLGRLVGERLRRGKSEPLEEGALVDWWRVARIEPGELVLRGVGWFPGDAWLGFRVRGGSLRQVAAFRPRGVPGFLYWKLLWPVHDFAFHRMARHRIRRATRLASANPNAN
jgi:uncharacterized protein YbjT (DUF2867 family)